MNPRKQNKNQLELQQKENKHIKPVGFYFLSLTSPWIVLFAKTQAEAVIGGIEFLCAKKKQ